MKNTLLKRVGLMSLALLSTASFTNKIAAAETKKVCTTHNNYYFFNEIRNYEPFKEEVEAAEPDGYIKSNRTYFPLIEKNAENIKDGRICLKKGDKTDGNCDIIWTLEDFYEKGLLINKGDSQTLKYDGEQETSYKSYSETIDGTVNTYFSHGKWFEVVNGEVNGKGQDNVDYFSINKEALVSASILPNMTSIHLDRNPKYSIYATVDRTIKKTDLEGITPFQLAWGSSTENVSSSLAPAVYYITYDTCEEKTVYNAKIDYLYADTNEPVTFEDDSTNPYEKGDLEKGYTEKVTSPKLEGCTVDKEEVTVTIGDEDFYEQVLYTCKEENVENPKTGNALIIIAWLIGLGALGYSAYYFINLKKTKMAGK